MRGEGGETGFQKQDESKAPLGGCFRPYLGGKSFLRGREPWQGAWLGGGGMWKITPRLLSAPLFIPERSVIHLPAISLSSQQSHVGALVEWREEEAEAPGPAGSGQKVKGVSGRAEPRWGPEHWRVLPWPREDTGQSRCGLKTENCSTGKEVETCLRGEGRSGDLSEGGRQGGSCTP